jgi:IS4 transposase
LTLRQVYCVTRLKENAVYEVVENEVVENEVVENEVVENEVVESRRVPHNRHVLAAQIMRLTGSPAAPKCPHLLGRIEVYDPSTDKVLVFVTNHLQFDPTTIAAMYKERWQIELFFKALQQNLKIKSFIGTRANALKTQVWTALSAVLLLGYLQRRSRFGWSFSTLVALLRLNLLTHRDLWAWLDAPYDPTAPS